MKSPHLKLVKSAVLRPVATTSRKSNTAYRVREHLTEAEMDKLFVALRRNRHAQRDWLVGLLIYRHGLRVSEAVIYGGMTSTSGSAPSMCDDSKAVMIAVTTWNETN
jgi:hypothetical protein